MKLRDFTRISTLYRNREDKINQVILSNININNIDENNIEITAVTNNKHTTILRINLRTKETKVFCDCESFNFEFAAVLLKHKALLNEEHFIERWKHAPPRKTNRRKNPYNVPAGCKHIIKLARYILIHLYRYLK